ncbi:Alpha/Beta hydrolase protein [Trichoderma evansii]
MPNTKSVEFQTRDGLTLRGLLTLMDKPGAPLVILLSPFGVISAQLMDVQAKIFNDGGFATLTYDPRTFGKSDGLPRHNINFDKQSEDVFDAVTYATSLIPWVDVNRIALLGGGHGGVKALIVQVPGLSGDMDARFYPPGLLDRSRRAFSEFSENSGKNQEYIQLFPASAEEAAANPQKALLGGPALFGFYSFIQTFTDGKEYDWENKVTLESAFYNFINEFRAYLPRVSPTPLLYSFFKIEPFDFAGYMSGTTNQSQQDIEVKFLQKYLM